jgi:hypothetical protein
MVEPLLPGEAAKRFNALRAKNKYSSDIPAKTADLEVASS